VDGKSLEYEHRRVITDASERPRQRTKLHVWSQTSREAKEKQRKFAKKRKNDEKKENLKL